MTLVVFQFTIGALAQGPLVINEIDVDQIGTDHNEFVELLNIGSQTIDFSITPRVLVFFNGGDTSIPVIDGSYLAVTLTGQLPPNQFLVIGSAQTENVDIVLGGVGGNVIQNGPDAVALYTGVAGDWATQRPPTTSNLIDAIVYHTGDDDDLLLQSALGVSQQFDEWNSQGSIGAVFSIARFGVGRSFQTGATPTPGLPNDADPPVFARDSITLVHRDDATPTFVALRGDGGVGALRFRVLTLPNAGTLFDDTNAITGAAGTALPYPVTGELTYRPASGFSGVDQFQFDALDALSRLSAPARHEVAVQAGGVVITEVMHSPGTFEMPQDQRVFEFIEVFNLTNQPMTITTLDGSFNSVVDTTNNLQAGNTPTVIPPRTMRVIAPGGLTDNSDRLFACEWGLDEADILRIPYQQYETLFDASRLLLFGENDVLLDAVSFWPPNFWTPVPGASQSVKEPFLVFCSPSMDTRGNDCPVVWPYSGLDNRVGRRTSFSGIGVASPGFIPAGLNESFTPLPECQVPALGACCLPDGRCAPLEQVDCTTRDGLYQGDYLPCDAAPACPQPPSGACCTPTGDCRETDPFTCLRFAGVYQGDNVACAGQSCPAQILLTVNEVEYNERGIDTGEYIELFGLAGLDVTGYSIVLYNGDPQQLRPYREIPLQGTIPTDGFLLIASESVPNVDHVAFTTEGIQNGDPDGIAIVAPDGVVTEAIAYGGSFTPTEGPAARVVFADVGVQDVAPPGDDATLEITLQRLPNGVGLFTMTTDRGLGNDGTPGLLNEMPLTAPRGACCLPETDCLDAVEPVTCNLAAGIYRGDATTCEAPCPVTTGACCQPNGLCEQLDQNACLNGGGAFSGLESICPTSPPCPIPPTGACCMLGGGCVIEDAYDCGRISGDYRGDNSACDQLGENGCGRPVELKFNEILRNDDGIDDHEFIEIVGPGGMDLSSLTVVEIEGDVGITGQQGRIDNLWSLTGMVIPGDGFFVLGDDAVAQADLLLGTTNRLENGTATYLLVDNFDAIAFPRGTDIDTDDDGAADPGTTLGAIVDGIAFVDSGIDAQEPQTDRIYFNTIVIGPKGVVAPAGAARRVDALDTGSPSDFCELGEQGDGSDGLATNTPGVTNRCAPCILPADADGNGQVDVLDFARLQICNTADVGPVIPRAYPIDCRCLDFDTDGDIDLTDFGNFTAAAGTAP